jgi:hypothetical protein
MILVRKFQDQRIFIVGAQSQLLSDYSPSVNLFFEKKIQTETEPSHLFSIRDVTAESQPTLMSVNVNCHFSFTRSLKEGCYLLPIRMVE